MNNKIKKIVIAIALVAVISAIYTKFIVPFGDLSTDNAYIQGEITQISTEVSGRVTKLYVMDNQWVTAGDLLATIDDRDYIARRNQEKSSVNIATSGLGNNQARLDLQLLKVEEAMAYIEAANAEDELQKRELSRYIQLVNSGAISKTLLDIQRSKATIAHAQYNAEKFKLSGAQQQVVALKTERTQLQARYQQAIASLQLSQLALEDTKIVAPISGFIGNRVLQEGKFVKAGAGVLAIVPVENIWLEANYKETQLTNLRPGQIAEVVLDMFPDITLKGSVESISPSTGNQFSLLPANNATGNFLKVVQRIPVKIRLEIPEALKNRIVPGLSAEVLVHLSDDNE
jgi:membrane fusion protein (multidrug efflux system)